MKPSAKRQPTTVGRRKFEELERQLAAAIREKDTATERAVQHRSEREAAAKEAAHWQGAAEMWRDRFEAEERRAARAEGYAEALLAKAYPSAPEVPWGIKLDQFGNPLTR